MSKKGIFKRKLWEILMVVFASLMVVVIGGYSIAMANSAALNNFFNISDSKADLSDDEEYQYFTADHDSSTIESYYSEVAEEAEAEGLVLLKNDNGFLPLDKGTEVSLFLCGSADINYTATGSSKPSDTSDYPTLKEALEDTDVGLDVNDTLWDFYVSGAGSSYGRTTGGKGAAKYNIVNEAPWSTYSGVLGSIGGTAVLTISREAGEGSDIEMSRSDSEDGSYISLTPEELEVMEQLTLLKEQGTIDGIVVLINTAAAVETDFLCRDGIDVDACMWIGNVGKYGLYAVADALVGNVVPSGKLADTFARDNASSPAAASHSYNTNGAFAQTFSNYSDYGLGSSQAYYGVYTEGIYVGYRYYETRYEDYVVGRSNVGDFDYSEIVGFPFGYGMSYTEFEYSDFSMEESVNEDGETVYTLSVKVTNIGAYDGKEVVEIYLQKPYTDYDISNGVEKAAAELVGFAKTDVLSADGGSETVEIEVTREQLKSYDTEGYGTYIIESGDYLFTAADSAHSAVNNFLAYKGYSVSSNSKMDADGDSSFVGSVTLSADTTTYAVSTETGNAIENQFDFADINRYEGRGDNSVTYVTRNDWNGTFPTASATLTVTDTMAEDLASDKGITEEEGAETPTYGADNSLNLVKVRGEEYDSENWDLLLDQMSFEEQSYLITNGQMTTVSVESVSKPQTHEGDGPTGYTYSEGGRSMPCEGIMAATYNKELIEKIGDCIAEDALVSDITGLYANAVNIHRSPFGGRGAEYYSEDPYLSGIASMNEINGIQANGVIVHVKHIAFNDMEDQRSGICVWLNEQEAREIMLVPFEYSLSPSKGNGHAVMSGFNRVGTIWAGASGNLLENVMRDEWGFDGYCITDMASSNGASYMSYEDGLMNGTDLWLGSGSTSTLSSYSGSATYSQHMREASHRILYVVANYSIAMNGYASETGLTVTTPWWQTTIIACIAVFAVLTAGSVALYAVSLYKDKKAEG